MVGLAEQTSLSGVAHMTNVLIVGAGGYGRVVAGQMQDDIACNKDWRIAGFLDERKNVLDGYQTDIPIVGDPFTYEPKPGDEFVCALGSPRDRAHYAAPLLSKGAYFMNILTEAYFGKRVTLGQGIFMERRVQIGPDCRIGSFVNIHSLSILGHDIEVGDYSQISCFSFIGGRTKIGANVTINPHACILPDVKIGDGAVIGAGSVVIGNVPAGVTVFGNPAKRLQW